MYYVEEIFINPKYTTFEDWVYTKPSVSVFVGKKIIKELFFDDLEEAKRYCDTNFHDVNFII